MISDTERREVARRLRDVEMHAIPDARIADNPMTVEFIAASVFYDLPYVRGLFSRLADLIESDEPKVKCVAEVKVDGERLEELAHDAAVELTGIDRDALLALADEMDVYSGHFLGDFQKCTVQAWAEAIREALEASDG